MIRIKLNANLSRDDVEGFLRRLKSVLYSEEFDIDRDLTIIRSRKKSGKEQC